MTEAQRIQGLKDRNGGHWGAHPRHTPADWVSETHQGNTRHGYWEWVDAMIDGEQG